MCLNLNCMILLSEWQLEMGQIQPFMSDIKYMLFSAIQFICNMNISEYSEFFWEVLSKVLQTMYMNMVL